MSRGGIGQNILREMKEDFHEEIPVPKIKELLNEVKTKMTFVDYIIKERSRKFLSISLMDMEKSNYKGTLEEWFSDMYTEYKLF